MGHKSIILIVDIAPLEYLQYRSVPLVDWLLSGHVIESPFIGIWDCGIVYGRDNCIICALADRAAAIAACPAASFLDWSSCARVFSC